MAPKPFDVSEWAERERLKQVAAGPHSLVVAALREANAQGSSWVFGVPTPIEQWIASHAE